MVDNEQLKTVEVGLNARTDCERNEEWRRERRLECDAKWEVSAIGSRRMLNVDGANLPCSTAAWCILGCERKKVIDGLMGAGCNLHT